MNNAAKKKILIVDDHPIVADGIKHILFGFDFVHEQSLEGAFNSLTQQSDIDLILLDLKLGEQSGFKMFDALENNQDIKTIPVVVFSSEEEAITVKKAISLGASGFIPKSMLVSELHSAVETVLDGGIHNSDWMLKKLAQAAEDDISLSKRQTEALKLMDQGFTNKQIASILFLSEHTIKYHIKSLFIALDANTRTACVRSARELGLLD